MSAKEEWRQGWGLVVAGMLGALLAATPSYSVGVFIRDFEAEFGWGRAQLAVAVSIISLVGAFASIAVGVAVDKFGARPLALIGVVVVSVAFAWLSQIEGTLASYWFHWALVAFAGSFCTFIVWTKGLVTHFQKSRGLALSLVICGTTLAGTVTPPLANYLIGEFGWRQAFVYHGGILFAVCFPIIFILFREVKPPVASEKSNDEVAQAAPKSGGQDGMTLNEALRTFDFWMLATPFFLIGGAVSCLPFHIIPLFEERGIAPEYAVLGLSLMSMTAVVGRISVGILLDRFDGRKVASASYCFAIVACGLLLSIPGGIIGSYAAAMFFGVTLGAATNLVPFITAQTFGLKAYATIYGVIKATFTIGAASFPPLVGFMYDTSGSYRTALFFLAAVFLASATLMQMSRKQAQAAPTSV